VIVAGEEGVVEDVTALFTVIAKADGTKVLISSNTIIGGKIILKPR
jgi:small-conductance mechanosensitive channel